MPAALLSFHFYARYMMVMSITFVIYSQKTKGKITFLTFFLRNNDTRWGLGKNMDSQESQSKQTLSNEVKSWICQWLVK